MQAYTNWQYTILNKLYNLYYLIIRKKGKTKRNAHPLQLISSYTGQTCRRRKLAEKGRGRRSLKGKRKSSPILAVNRRVTVGNRQKRP